MTPEEINQECITRLEAASLSTRIVVVGSGPSSPHIASVDELQNRLAAGCGVSRGPTEEFWLFCDRAHDSNPAAYFSVIRQAYGSTPHLAMKVYTHLVKMPFLGYATLNYDEQLPNDFRTQRPGATFLVYPPAVPGVDCQWPKNF